jgi:hypothetical protein
MSSVLLEYLVQPRRRLVGQAWVLRRGSAGQLDGSRNERRLDLKNR